MRAESSIHKRLLDTAQDIATNLVGDEQIVFQHTVFCQTGLPYRQPKSETRTWERTNGLVTLLVEAGRALDPKTGRFIELPLPSGAKPRLILAHLNSRAMREGPEVDVGRSMTAFVKRLGFHAHGRDIRTFKEQMAALSAASLRIGLMQPHDQSATTIKTDIIAAFDLWFAKDDRQRVLWPSTVRLSEEYFKSLQRHAVPLDERALAALSHSPMALDAYTWLAQRLHRIGPQGAQISWAALHGQFGTGYREVRQFRAAFRRVLREVLTQYPAARLEENDRGLKLLQSTPPITRQLQVVSKKGPSRDSEQSPSMITSAGIDLVKHEHPDWDVEFLLKRWQAWNLGKAVRHPDRAFAAWARSFTKNKPPS